MNIKVSLSKPSYKIDQKSLEKDMVLAREKHLFRYAIRRRIVFFMDGYRYAINAVKKRWGLDIIFFEAGHELVKPIYFIEKFNEDAALLWLKKLNEGESFADKLIGELKDIIETAKKLVASVPERPLKSAEIRDLLLAHLAWWIEYFEVGFLWFSLENIREKIDEEIGALWKGSKNDLQYFLGAVYRPIKLPLSSLEQRDLLKLKQLSGDERDEALKAHWLKYRHLAIHDSVGDEFFTLEYFTDRLKIFDQTEEFKKVKEAFDMADQEMVKATKLTNEADLPEVLKKKIDFVRWFMYIRTDSIDHFTAVNGAYKRVFESLADLFNLPMGAVLMMTYEEIISSLEKRELTVARDTVLDREKRGYAYFIGPSGSYLVTGDDIDQIHTFVAPKETGPKPKEVKGQTAFAGVAKGPARVVLDSNKANEVKEGEILVTTMTNPEYVPAMQRSAGIVTNEGGILCHAAIMSREFRKPCIIGTKIATDVFQTGQIIELDAKNGTARIVE